MKKRYVVYFILLVFFAIIILFLLNRILFVSLVSPVNVRPPIGLNLLGGQSSFCTNLPFLIEGKDMGARVAAYLGMYKDGGSPQFGPANEAEISVNKEQEIKVKFHPKNPYMAHQSDFNNRYFLYIGLIPPWKQPQGKSFEGCGYDGTMLIPTGEKHFHFKGEFKWVSEESNPPPDSGAGNTLFGGWLAYNFIDSKQDIVAIDDFGTPPGTNPGSLSEAYYECGDWWHNLMWSDWWKENGSLNDKWFEFDIDVTAASEKAIQKSGKFGCGTKLSKAANISIAGLFVGPEYGVYNGGTSVFMLRNLRAETY